MNTSELTVDVIASPINENEYAPRKHGDIFIEPQGNGRVFLYNEDVEINVHGITHHTHNPNSRFTKHGAHTQRSRGDISTNYNDIVHSNDTLVLSHGAHKKTRS